MLTPMFPIDPLAVIEAKGMLLRYAIGKAIGIDVLGTFSTATISPRDARALNRYAGKVRAWGKKSRRLARQARTSADRMSRQRG